MVLNACMIVIEHVHIIYIQYIFTYIIYIYIYNYICIYITHLPKSETVRIHPPLTAPYEAPVNRMVCQFNQMPRMKLWYLCVETVVSEANKNTCIYCKFIYIYIYALFIYKPNSIRNERSPTMYLYTSIQSLTNITKWCSSLCRIVSRK